MDGGDETQYDYNAKLMAESKAMRQELKPLFSEKSELQSVKSEILSEHNNIDQPTTAQTPHIETAESTSINAPQMSFVKP